MPARLVARGNKSAEGAIAQIKDKKYTDWIKEYTGDILLIGIDYNTNTKIHECIIEKCEKVV